MKLRRSAAVLVGATVLLAGCGSDDLPSKSEFVTEMKKSMTTELSSLEDAGIDKAAAEKIFDDFIGCTYDKVKDNEDLLRKAYDDGGDSSVSAQLEEKAASCVEDLTAAATEAATGAAAGG